MMKLRIASCGGQPCVLGVSPFLDWNTEEDKRGRGLLHGRLWIPNKAWGHGSFWCVVIVLLGSLDLLQKIKVKLPALPFPSTQHLWIGLEDGVSIWWKALIWIAVRLVAVAIRWGLDDVDARKLSTIMWTRIFRGPGWIVGQNCCSCLRGSCTFLFLMCFSSELKSVQIHGITCHYAIYKRFLYCFI